MDNQRNARLGQPKKRPKMKEQLMKELSLYASSGMDLHHHPFFNFYVIALFILLFIIQLQLQKEGTEASLTKRKGVQCKSDPLILSDTSNMHILTMMVYVIVAQELLLQREGQTTGRRGITITKEQLSLSWLYLYQWGNKRLKGVETYLVVHLRNSGEGGREGGGES